MSDQSGRPEPDAAEVERVRKMLSALLPTAPPERLAELAPRVAAELAARAAAAPQ